MKQEEDRYKVKLETEAHLMPLKNFAFPSISQDVKSETGPSPSHQRCNSDHTQIPNVT
jgi:hypothetical protein